MDKFIKYIVESKFDFNIDVDSIEISNDKELSLGKSVQTTKSQLTEYANSIFPLVDLGLPSKTLWAKYNLGVNPDDIEECTSETWNGYKQWIGGYYKWGDKEDNKHSINDEWNNYKYAYITYNYSKGYNISLTKYCTNENLWASNKRNSTIDNLEVLQLEDDAAYCTYESQWRIPCRKDFNELKKYCALKWIDEYYGIPKLNGMKFTSKVNGNSIFIPAGKQWQGKDYEYCYLWLSELCTKDPKTAYCVEIKRWEKDNVQITNKERRLSFNIRPVFYRTNHLF